MSIAEAVIIGMAAAANTSAAAVDFARARVCVDRSSGSAHVDNLLRLLQARSPAVAKREEQQASVTACYFCSPVASRASAGSA
jgi:hypothetical protein